MHTDWNIKLCVKPIRSSNIPAKYDPITNDNQITVTSTALIGIKIKSIPISAILPDTWEDLSKSIEMVVKPLTFPAQKDRMEAIMVFVQ